MPRCRACALVLALVAGAVAPGAPGPVRADAEAREAHRQRRSDRFRAMADAYRAAGDVVTAASWYHDAIDADPGDTAAWRGLAATWVDQGDLGRAARVLRDALRRHPEDRGLWLEVARVHGLGGDPAAAAEALRALVERRPDDPRARAALARDARRRGAWSEALASYRALRRLLPGAADPELAEEAANAVPALALLVGELDPVSSPSRCDRGASPVRRALAGCGR